MYICVCYVFLDTGIVRICEIPSEPCWQFLFSFDGDGEVVSRVRRGVLSLRVVRQMLS